MRPDLDEDGPELLLVVCLLTSRLEDELLLSLGGGDLWLLFDFLSARSSLGEVSFLDELEEDLEDLLPV